MVSKVGWMNGPLAGNLTAEAGAKNPRKSHAVCNRTNCKDQINTLCRCDGSAEQSMSMSKEGHGVE